MPKIRLLTSIAGNNGVEGDYGDIIEVDEKLAKVWADGVRAERVVIEARTARPRDLEDQMQVSPRKEIR